MLTSAILALSMLNTTYCGGMCCAPRPTLRATPPKAARPIPTPVGISVLLVTPQPWRSILALALLPASR